MTRNRGTFVATAIVASVMLWSVAGAAAQSGIANDPILQAPPYQGQPINIAVGLHIINIASIDEVTEQFEMDSYLFERWIDPRLAFTPSGPGDRERNYAVGQIWIPQLEMINAATPRTVYDTSIRVTPDGTVK
jgi:Neurotransmitter-gated ion-channel ligand binding domain